MQVTYTYIQNLIKAKCSKPAYLLGLKHLIQLLVTGIEPVRCRHHGILSPARLPVPPHQHISYISTNKFVFQQIRCTYGTYRARTYDPLLVRQMLSQLS